MATLPPSSDITNSSATEGNAKTWFSAVRTFIAQMLGTDGTQSAALSALGVPFHSSLIKTGAYTVVPADRGKVLKCSGTWTLAFSAVATLGDGFVVEVVNDGGGVITLDPDLSQMIDGFTTISLAAGKSLVVYCDGTKFVTFGRGGVETFNTRSGAVTLTSGDVTTALGGTPSMSGHTHNYAPMTAIVDAYPPGNPLTTTYVRANGSTFSIQLWT